MNSFLLSPSDNFASVRDGRTSMPLYFDVDLSVAHSVASGNPLIFLIAGNSLYSDQNILQGIATVHFQDTSLGISAAPITVNPGFICKVPYTQLLIENVAQANKRLRIFYGVDIDFMPGTGGQVSVSGTVSVINGELARVKANQCYIGNSSSQPAAGLHGYVQIANTSINKNLIVTKMASFCSTLTGIWLTKNAALGSFAMFGVSKNLTYSNGVGSIRSGDSPSIVGTNLATSAVDVGFKTVEIILDEPILIPPGMTISTVATETGVGIWTSFQWTEEDI